MTRPAQDWMTAREAADHLGVPLARIRELLQNPGAPPHWAHDQAGRPVNTRRAGVRGIAAWPSRTGRGVKPIITDPAEVADIVDAYTVRRHAIGRIAQNKGEADGTIRRIVNVAGVPLRPRGRPRMSRATE